ncbi:MAG: hypothetical protein ACFFBP_23320 [Promethearchaeota archaeon]
MRNDKEPQIHELVSSIPEKEKFNMMSKNWLSHDARWQIGSVMFLGWDKANKLNQDVTKQIGKILMFRLMNALNISQVNNFHELMLLLGTAIYLNFSVNPSNWQMEIFSNELCKVEIEKCLTFENIKRAGAIGNYDCACFALREGFFDALNLQVEQSCQKSLMKGDDKCEICLKIKNWNKNNN